MQIRSSTVRLVLGTALLAAALIVVGGIQATPTSAAKPNPSDTGNIAIFKTMCVSIGKQNTCNGRDTSLSGYKVDFNVYAGTATSGTPLQTITVTLGKNAGGNGNTGNGSQGRAVGGTLPARDTYTVCEVPIAYKSGQPDVGLVANPRPDLSTGGANQSRQTAAGGDCIRVNLVPGTAELKFLDQKLQVPVVTGSTPTATTQPSEATKTPKPTETAEAPTETPAPTLTVQGSEATNTPQPTETEGTPTNTPQPVETETEATPTNAPSPTSTVLGVEATQVPTAQASPTAVVLGSEATQVPTATPNATSLPKTGEPPDGSLALLGLMLMLGGVFAFRLARVQQPTAGRGDDGPGSDAR